MNQPNKPRPIKTVTKVLHSYDCKVIDDKVYYEDKFVQNAMNEFAEQFKPLEFDSLHVGELTDKLNKMHNSDFTGWSKDAKNAYLTAVITLTEWQRQLSEAGEIA